MTTPSLRGQPGCASLDDVLEEAAVGGALAPALAAHLAGCVSCQARLALARRIDDMLAGWPEAAPPPHFAAVVARRAREGTWRQEMVVDWGFNLAIAASLVLIAAGATAFLWMLGAVADPAGTSRLVSGQLASVLAVVRGQVPVVATATVLVATTVAALWWAEERRRW